MLKIYVTKNWVEEKGLIVGRVLNMKKKTSYLERGSPKNDIKYSFQYERQCDIQMRTLMIKFFLQDFEAVQSLFIHKTYNS